MGKRCPYCGEDVKSYMDTNHVCYPRFSGFKEIEIMYWFNEKEEDGVEVVLARGWDGILYRLRRVKNPSRRNFTGGESDSNLTEPSITLFIYARMR